MANETQFYNGIVLPDTPSNGAGDPLLTRATGNGLVRQGGTALTNALTSSYIIVGNASNVATPRALTGDLSINDLGIISINANVIIDADINAAAAIALTKLAALTPNRAVITNGSGFLTVSNTTAAQVGFLSTVTSSVQTQINSKQGIITGGASTITSTNLAVNRALISNGAGKVAVHATTTSTAVGFIANLTSDSQAQHNTKILGRGVSAILQTPGAGQDQYVITYDNGTSLFTLSAKGSTGIPAGGTTGQYLNKIDGTNYNAQWSTLTLSKITDVAATASEVNILSGLTGVTTTELSYVGDLTGMAQAQINAKLSTSLAYNSLFIGNAANTATQLGPGLAGQVLTIVSGAPVWQTPAAGSGTVTGVAPSTDNALVRWNGTLADSIQNSGIIIDDTDNITGIASLRTLNQGGIILRELTANGTNAVTVRASANMSADYTITLPAAAPTTNDYLKYDGTNYVWAAAGGGGSVTSVTGTASRITSTGGITPIIDISAAYVGQASITTLGTITTGVWSATQISLARGGTGNNLIAPGADRILFYDDSAGVVTWLEVDTGLAIGGTVLTNSLVSRPRNQTFAGDGITTSFVIGDALDLAIAWVEVGGVIARTNEYLTNDTTKTVTFAVAPVTGQHVGIYYFTSSVIGSITLANGNGTTANSNAADLGGTITGDIQIAPAVDNTFNMYIGTDSGQTKSVTSATLAAHTLNLYAPVINEQANTLSIITNTALAINTSAGTLALTLGSDATGDTYYRNSSGFITRRAIGSAGQVYTVAAGIPTWATPASTSVTLTGEVTGSGTGSFATTITALAVTTGKIADGAITDIKLRASAAESVIGRASSTGGAPADIVAGAENHVLRRLSNTVAFGFIAPASIAMTTGTLVGGVAGAGAEITIGGGLQISGGALTSISSLSTNEIPKYNGTIMAGTGVVSTATATITLGIAASSAGTTRTMDAAGTQANIDIIIAPKGTGVVRVNNGGTSAISLGAASEFTIVGNATSGYAEITAGGDTQLGSGLKLLTNVGTSSHNDGRNIEFVASDAYTTSGNGSGGDIILTPGAKRTAGSGRGGSIYAKLGSNGNFGIINSATGAIFGSGERVVYLSNAATNPTSNPTLGAVVYADAAVGSSLKTRNPAGDVYDMTLQTREAGTNKTVGTVTLVGGTATISNTRVTANSIIFYANIGGIQTNASYYRTSAKSAGVSFTVTSGNASDTSTIAWWLIEPVTAGGGGPSPTPVGVIHTDSFAGTLSKYNVVNGPGTISIVSGKLRLTGGTGTFASYIELTDATNPFRVMMLEEWDMEITFTTPTISSTTYGLSLGVRSTMASAGIDNMVRLSMDTGSPLGSFYFYTSNNHAAPNQDVQSSYTMISGTTYKYRVSRSKNTITATLKNAGGATLNTVTKTYNISTTNGVWNANVGRFCIWNHGGTIDITDITYSSTASRYTNFYAVGDSNMHGLYAASTAGRYVELSAVAKGYTVSVAAGISQGVADVQTYVDQIIFMGASRVYLNCVSNDVANSVPAATYKANYQALVTAIKAGIPGVIIIHGVPVARGYDWNTLWTTWLTANYPGEPIVNLYPTTKAAASDALNATYNSGDSIHMNAAGNTACEPILTAQL